MERHGFVEGTSGITYVHKKDDRRHRKHCVHYRKDGSCAYMSKCGGVAQCGFYSEIEIDVKSMKLQEKSSKNNIVSIKKINIKADNCKNGERWSKYQKIGSRITHKKYGDGTVVSYDGKYIKILFDTGKSGEFDFETCIKNNVFNN